MRAVALVLTAAALALFAASCGGGAGAGPQVTIEPLASVTPPGATAFGGKPAAPPAAAATDPARQESAAETATAAPARQEPPSAASTEAPASGAPASSTAETPASHAPVSSTAEASPTPALPPSSGRWIDVDVARFEVRLMDGATVLQKITPVAVGVQIDTGEYASTQTGLFHVYNKIADLAYDPPYGTYISDWVGFDPAKANGFHSFLKDQTGKVVDAATGRVSNGCIRTGAERAIYAFAEIGMPVFVHA